MKAEAVTVIAGARRAALEAESHIGLALGMLEHVRWELSRVEEENRDLRVEAAKRQMEFYTEREFAQLLKVSESTVARLRKTGKLKHLQVGGLIRYTSAQLAQFVEVFAAGNKPKVRGSFR